MARVSTNQNATPLELAVSIKTILEIYRIQTEEIEGSIISSVVPSINNSMRKAIEKIASCPVLVVGPGIRTGLQIAIDNPAQLGSDRVADAVAALHEYEPPIVIIDMGTATTFSVIDARRRHIGGVIAPGVGISLNALTEKTAQLPKISFEPPKKCIGSNTVACMKSGILYGAAGCIDGLLDRITEELGETPMKRTWAKKPKSERKSGRSRICAGVRKTLDKFSGIWYNRERYGIEFRCCIPK